MITSVEEIDALLALTGQELSHEYSQNVEATNEVLFAKVRSHFCYKGCEKDIPQEWKDHTMDRIGEPRSKWGFYEGRYRKCFKTVRKAIQEGNRTNIKQRIDVGHLAVACLESHNLSVDEGTCKELQALTAHLERFVGSCLGKATRGRGKRKASDANVTQQYLIGDRLAKNTQRKKAFQGARANKKDKK